MINSLRLETQLLYFSFLNRGRLRDFFVTFLSIILFDSFYSFYNGMEAVYTKYDIRKKIKIVYVCITYLLQLLAENVEHLLIAFGRTMHDLGILDGYGFRYYIGSVIRLVRLHMWRTCDDF